MGASPHRDRIKMAVYLLSKFLREAERIDRREAAEILRREYERHNIKPIMGKTVPADIYDKELATLYVVGKYGLGLDRDHPEVMKKLFYVEEALEEALSLIERGEAGKAREILKGLSPANVVESNTIARLLRLPLVKYIVGFATEEELAKVFRSVAEAFPEEEKTVRSYVRFFIALKLAEGIKKGEIRNRAYKEAAKRAMAIRLGFPKCTPSDDYVAAVAENVFNMPRERLSSVLSLEGDKGGAQERPSARPG